MSIFNGTADDIFNKKTDYPVGSVCMFNTNIDPNEMYGGTWVRIKSKFILGADDDTYPLGSEGGEATHTLTEAELAKHRHEKIYYSDEGRTFGLIGTGTSSTSAWYLDYASTSDKPGDSLNTGYKGGNQPHNNMPPYVAFCIWAKVA